MTDFASLDQVVFVPVSQTVVYNPYEPHGNSRLFTDDDVDGTRCPQHCLADPSLRVMKWIQSNEMDTSSYARLLSRSVTVDLVSVAGGAVGSVLEVVVETTCSLILLTDGTTSPSSIFEETRKWSGCPWGVSVFQAAAGDLHDNVTITLLSHLLYQARRVRVLSWCVRMVVVSQDPVFLATFAEISLKKRLLVWDTKLLVLTRLSLTQLHTLISSYWTFTMMNTVFLNVDDAQILRARVYTQLPYSVEGAKMVQLAHWKPQRGLLCKPNVVLFPAKFSNFYGARVNVTALPFPPYWDEVKGPDNTTVYSGTDFYTLEAISMALNFTINVVPTTSWAEVTQRVEERVAFLAAVFHNILPERLERYDYSWQYEYASLDFSMAVLGIKPQWQSLYYPLTDLVWLAIALALFVAPIILLLIIRVSESREDVERTDASVVVHHLTGMLLGQNLPRRLPKTCSSRVLVAVWLIFGLIITTAYRGNLTAFLSLPKYPPRAETLQQLVTAAERITMPTYGAEFKIFFSKSDSQVFQRVGQLMHIVPSVEIGQQQATERK
nr:uncharacterized protein LOC128704756 [Cherax quadricarinatus]